MPGLNDLERLAQGHGMAVAILLVAIPALALVIVALWRENRRLYQRIEQLLEARGEMYGKMLLEAMHGRANR
ncbi:MAG: hypothetical protein KJZ84_24020 [Bryobacteraceae bacterium]|nr:hypothetical protein [Bryobacteraceae bacterium]